MKQLQQQNKQNIDLLSAYFQYRTEPNYAWSRACSMFLALPGLRGFWPMSSVDYAAANRGIDESGQGNHLTDNNTPLFGYDSLASYVEFNGTNQYLSRADGGAGNWADVIGTETYISSVYRGLTIGGWFYFERATGPERLIGKFNPVGNQRSYMLLRSGGNFARLVVSVDGTATLNVNSTSTIATGEWLFLVGRFIPSTSTTIFVNDESTNQLVGVPASIFDSTSIFTVGVQGDLTSYFDGRASMCFLCAAQLSDAIILSLFEQTKAMYNVT